MFTNKPLRVALAVLLVGFAWLTLSTWHEDSARARVANSMMATFALLLAIGIGAPTRGRVALRIGAGVIGAAYVFYFATELWRLVRGEPRPLRPGQPSATMAGVGLLVYGLPMLVFALSGYPGQRYRNLWTFFKNEPDGGDRETAG